MKPINIGVIGFGTIGGGVVEALLERRSYLKKKTGLDLNLKMVCDKDVDSKRTVALDKKYLVKDARCILEDPKIDIVVELIGGIHPAKEMIKKALSNGKDVVTANKALLCEEGKELFRCAAENGRTIRFEASVGGGIPIIKSLKEGLVSNKIEAIYGIVNGTSNYILWRMRVEGCTFEKALSDAKTMGIAENDATLDVSGTDSAHKLALLALLGFGKSVSLDDIYVEGITKIDPSDMEYARDLGYRIKLLAIPKKVDNQIELKVHPTLIEEDHPLSNVTGLYNAIYVKGDLVGESFFYGKGAGRYPTSSAVVADIVDLARSVEFGPKRPCEKMGFQDSIKKIRPMDEMRSRYYVRFQAKDKPGVLASISGILAEHKISIASVRQVQRSSQDVVPIVMLTHEALERSMMAALKKIDALSCIKPSSIAIRIEEL